MKNRHTKNSLTVGVLFLMLMAACALALFTGSAKIPLTEIPGILLSDTESVSRSIIFGIRLPRLLLGLAVGGALSLAGTLLQGMFRNPLVEPYTLGISGGASLGVCLNITFQLHALIGVIAYPLSGFLGSLTVIVLVYLLSRNAGTLKTNGMLLTGVMISFVSASLVMFIMAISESQDIHAIVFWIMGSLDVTKTPLVIIAVFGALGGLLIAYLFCLDLNALALGEEDAFHLGVNVDRTKTWLFIIASMLTGLSVSVAGIIGFVGLIVPHFMRMITGADHRWLLLESFLAGAAFLVFCDITARTIISPLELPVGVITGIIGGIVFIYALGKKQIVL
ncbi:MAG: iron ABC transporter permease [Thermodesulfobacteriota bacterium]|nr:iron ABC transporter permease [Thermodesulfobacteriota bacterium]